MVASSIHAVQGYLASLLSLARYSQLWIKQLLGRSLRMGNPTHYATFVDESLNFVLRSVASASYRHTMERRVLQHFNIIGELGLQPFIYGSMTAKE